MPLKAPLFWQKKHSWQGSILRPLGHMWSLGSLCHRKMSNPSKIPVPVISIGNISLGGAGKTPLVSYLASHFHHCAIVTRGYGSMADTVIHVQDDHDFKAVGDEPLLLSKHAPTFVAPNRYKGAMAAVKKNHDLIILDDGHQHYKLYKDISLLVVDGHLGWGNEQVFPSGPLREPIHRALHRCTALIIIGPDTWGIKTWVKDRVPLFQGNITTLFQKPSSSKPYGAFAGIAYPEKFLRLLNDLHIHVSPFLTYPDHHVFTPHDLGVLEKLTQTHTLLTTEKDWVRLPLALRQAIVPVPITLIFDGSNDLLGFIKNCLETLALPF